ncbi:MAG: hypothetical protein K0S84_1525 [Nitrososphaera sp.]|jgi:hypothetical protein|nr:hypothetical protein [Nitrososphaera sp.]
MVRKSHERDPRKKEEENNNKKEPKYIISRVCIMHNEMTAAVENA